MDGSEPTHVEWTSPFVCVSQRNMARLHPRRLSEIERIGDQGFVSLAKKNV